MFSIAPIREITKNEALRPPPSSRVAAAGNKEPVLPANIVAFVFIYALILNQLQVILSGGFQGENLNIATAQGNVFNQIIWILIAGMAGYAWIKQRPHPPVNFHLALWLLLAYLCLALLSCLWSDVPAVGGRRAIQQVLVVASVLVPFMLVKEPSLILRRICWVFGAIVLLNVALIPLIGLPAFGYQGIYGQKNEMGQIAVVAFYFCAYSAIRQRWITRGIFILLALLAIGLTIVSKSKTSISLMLLVPLAMVVVVAVARMRNAMARTIAVIAAVLFAALCIAFITLEQVGITDISKLLFHDATFTGRTKIWVFAGRHIDQAPFIGYGYGSFWGIGEGARALGEGFIGNLLQAHNGYVDIVLQTGYVGLALATALLVSMFVCLWNFAKYDGATGLLLLSCYFFLITNNFMESSLFRGFVPLWILFLLCGAAAGIRKKHSRQDAEKTEF